MNRKRRVILYVNGSTQFTSEFHENTKMKMVRSYLKDVSHIQNFSLVTNLCSNFTDENSLKEIAGYHKDIFFRVVKSGESSPDNNGHEVEELAKENEILRVELNSYIIQNQELAQDNSKLIKMLDELNLKCQSMQIMIDELNLKLETLPRFRENLTLETENKLISKRLSMRKSSLMISNSNSSANTISMRKKESLKVEPQGNMKLIFEKVVLGTKDKGCKSERKSILDKNLIPKPIQTNRKSALSIKNIHNPPKQEILPKISSEHPIQDLAKHVYPFLSLENGFTFALCSRTFLKIYYDYQISAINTKLNEVKGKMSSKKAKLQEQTFTLSPGTASCIKLLNKTDIKEIFSNDFPFSQEYILVYRLLMQACLVNDLNVDKSDSQFSSEVRKYFLNLNEPLGDHIKALSHSFDLSDKNVEKMKNLLDFYHCKTVNPSVIGRADKTAGMISFIIRDLLQFCGLVPPENEKTLTSQSSRERLLVLGEVHGLESEQRKNEMVKARIELLKSKYTN